MDLKVKLLSDKATAPTRAHHGDAGLDLYTTGQERINAYCWRTVDFGVAVEIPLGYVGKVHIRSGVASKGFLLAQGVGVIDSGYRGSIKATLYNIKDFPQTIEANERVCQLLIEPIELPNVVITDELSKSERGAGGFGSSGK